MSKRNTKRVQLLDEGTQCVDKFFLPIEPAFPAGYLFRMTKSVIEQNL
jgi:hypothetical protein